MTKLLRKATVGSLACTALLAAAAFAGPAAAASPARDEAPRGEGAAARSASPQKAGPEALRGAKVPVRVFPQTMGGATVLFDNGPIVTHPGGGAGGADASALQSALLMNTFGFTCSDAGAFRIADDFTVPPGEIWDLTTVTVFGYQTGSTTTSTFDVGRIQIWDGAPNAGGTVVFGDVTTNRMASTAWSNAYRVLDTTLTNNQRPVMEVVMNTVTTLDEGTYWVDIQIGGTLASGPFCPPISVLGQTTTGNALQFDGTLWNPMNDTGTNTQQGLPFVVEGTSGGNASITLNKTVGTVPAVCATTDSVTVASGTTVYYCFEVENTGGVTFEFHDLEDDHLGPLLSNFPATLGPGDTLEFIEPDTASVTVTNTGTWTAKEVIPGYTFDNTVAQGFTDISATGTALNLTDDGVAPVTMPFNFELYGASSNQLCVSNNGNMAFGTATCSGAFTNEPLPSATLGGAAIVPYWDDLDEESGNVYHQAMGSAPNRVFIVQWHQRPHFPGPNANTVTFQAVLRETANTLNFYYLDTTFGDPATNNGASATVGLQQSTTVANQYSFDTAASIPDNEAILAAIAGGEEATASDTATVTIADPDIDVDPTSLSSTLGPDEQETQTLDIHNLGTGDLEWDFEEAPPAPRVSIPRSDGNFPRGKHAPSTGLAPTNLMRPTTQSTVNLNFGTTPAYSWNSQNGPYYTVFDLGVPEELPNIAPFPGNGQFIGAGEFVDGLVYMVDVANTMWEMDPATGAILDTFTATAPSGGETWSGMAIDPTSGTVYAGSTNVATSGLYTMDVTTGVATFVGPVTNCPGLIALAVDGNGDLWGYDIVGDILLSIDKTTGAGTVVGPIGFDANFGQGMGYDPASDTVYMAAFNNGTFQPELRSVDTSTGNTTLVGVLGSTIPGGLNQLSWLGLEIGLGPCSAPQDLPWVSVDPTSGTTAPAATSTVDVTFDSTGLAAGLYEGFLCINSNDPDEDPVEVPVSLTVDEMPFFGDFEEGDFSEWSFTLP